MRDADLAMASKHVENLHRSVGFGFLDRSISGEHLYHPKLISNMGDDTMLGAIRNELKQSQSFTLSVAFIIAQALAQLKGELVGFRGSGRIVTSRYLDFNEPDMFRELLNLDGVEVFVYQGDGAGFHAKGYVFQQPHSLTAIIGSSNLTANALTKNKEWNLKFSAMPDGDITRQVEEAIEAQIREAIPLSQDWISAYERDRRKQILEKEDLSEQRHRDIFPNKMQVAALAEIETLRKAQQRRAVVISATGTGKTILGALSVKAAKPKKFLFVVHRGQILHKALAEFQKVLHHESPEQFGVFMGSSKELEKKYVFASIQSISRKDNLDLIEPGTFDYVIIDEVHRAGGATYRNLIEHLDADFLLGLTATPERTDDFNIYELFDFNVAFEIRLQHALENDMLVPFSYYGVTDFVRDGQTVDDTSQLAKLVETERVDHILEMLRIYGFPQGVCGLMFCSRTDEAHELSQLLNQRNLNGRRLRTKVLTGSDNLKYREQVVAELEEGQLDYILTVDIFNEGIDIPAVNQIVMLRQTQSSIIVTQQLGRGLRKSKGKDHLRVIDFIGNYKNNYLIPIALFGDSSLNKDEIRRKLIDVDTRGTIAGVSTVNFDEVARQRILDSLAQTKLDSMVNLKTAVIELRNRLNHLPGLYDFARFDTVDPVVVATARKEYWSLLHSLKFVEEKPSAAESHYLMFLTREVLDSKRPYEALILQCLMAHGPLSLVELYAAIVQRDPFKTAAQKQTFLQEVPAEFDQSIQSALRVLLLEFATSTEKKALGNLPLLELRGEKYQLSQAFLVALQESETFAEFVEDYLKTTLFLARHKYSWDGKLIIGQRYSRRDALRLLNWQAMEIAQNIGGYKLDQVTGTCPIFVTYHKADDISESTKYDDKFLDAATMHWFTKNRRTLSSPAEKLIAGGEVCLHLFVKKDDAEGTEFYYLGEVTPSEAKDGEIQVNGKSVSIVDMKLTLHKPLTPAMFEYFAAEQRLA